MKPVWSSQFGASVDTLPPHPRGIPSEERWSWGLSTNSTSRRLRVLLGGHELPSTADLCYGLWEVTLASGKS